jgi:hypothetical protein
MNFDVLRNYAQLIEWPMDAALFKPRSVMSRYRHTLDADGTCSERGIQAEDRFGLLVQSKYPLTRAVPHNCKLQIVHHIDFVVVLDVIESTGQALVVFVDVKSAKKSSRSSADVDRSHVWLELHNDSVHRYTWMGTKVKYAGPSLGPQYECVDDTETFFSSVIALEQPDEGDFLLVDRKRLIELTRRAMDWSDGFVRTAARAVWKPYRRYGKSFEIITRSPIEDICENTLCGSTGADFKLAEKKEMEPCAVLDDLSAYLDSL